MRRGKKLNIPLIKSAVMFVAGAVLAAGTALSGIGPQVAAAPTIHFLLGFSEERTKGTAMAFALFAAGGGAAAVAYAGIRPSLVIALLLFIGATCGVLLVGRYAQDPRLRGLRRAGQTIGILIGVTVIREGLRQRIGGPPMIPIGLLQDNALVAAPLIGLITGALSGVLQIPSGVLLVPALIYLGKPIIEAQAAAGLAAPAAIGYALIVIALAALLPTVSYAAQQAVDRPIGRAMAIGGIVGGASAGLLLGRLAPGSPIPLEIFGLIAMFLSAWQIWKMT